MSDQADQMAPDASPGAVSKKSGVRRVNNMPMYILAAALGAFLLVMMLVAADRAAKQNAPANGPAERAGNTSMFAKEIVGDKDGGIVEPASMLKPPEMPTAPDAPPVLVARPDNLDAPPPPPGRPESTRPPPFTRARLRKTSSWRDSSMSCVPRNNWTSNSSG